jgi:hypothetical protein
VAKFRKGSSITWKWLGRLISGKVEAVYLASVTEEIKGKKITRHGSKEKPAYLVRSSVGNLALKLETELSPVVKNSKIKLTPKIFK